MFSDEIDFDSEPPASLQTTLPPAPEVEPVTEAVNGNGSKSSEPEQISLLELPEDWKAHWKEMPAFAQKNLSPWFTLPVHFENRQDLEAFGKLVNQKIGLNTRSIWFPEAEIGRMMDKRFVSEPENENIEILDCE